jgi:hypothetical protein
MPRRWLPVVVFAVATSLATAAVGQQRDTAPPAPATGRIAGTVVGAESGTPVRFAKVTLRSGTGGEGTSVLTDESGAFSFANLKPGSYGLVISKPGYLETVYGQTRPGTDTPGKSISLRDREQIDRLTVPLSHGASIAGVVRDDRGEPLFGATVRVQRWVTRNGVRALDTVASTETDERGGYRLALLPSRQYILSAARQPASCRCSFPA